MIEQASLVLGNGNWAVKSDSLLGYKTINGKYYPREFTFTRATTGTRVNEAGLVELVPYNLVQYSEQFDNAYWTKANANITANATTAPNGTTTADKLITSLGLATGRFAINPSMTNTVYSISIYAKQSQNLSLRIGVDGGYSCYYNLSTGTVGTQTNATGTITNVGDGWYRCTFTFTLAIAGTPYINFIIVNNDESSYTGDGTSGIYIWGAQLVDGTAPLDYLPTTDRLDIPRIDYSAGEPALLLEPQRTNFLLNSNNYSSWNKIGVTITQKNDNSILQGDINSEFLFSNSSYCFTTVSSLVNGYNCYSLYIKNVDFTNSEFIGLVLGGSTYASCNYYPSTGVVNSLVGNATDIKSIVTQMSNGYYRVSLIANTTSSWNIQINSDFSKKIRVSAINVEAGTYPTSYIPTTSTSVTRNLETVVKTDATALIGQTEGTIFIDFIYIRTTGDANGRLLQLYQTNESTNSILPLIFGSGANPNQFQLTVASNTIAAVIIPASASTTIPFGRQKIAIAYNSGNYVVYRNGYLFASASGIAPLSLTSIDLGGSSVLPRKLENPINAAALWKTALTNDELATLTTL